MNAVNDKWLNTQLKNIQPYEPGRPIEEVARELNIDADAISKVASNENPLGPSPKALQAMQETASEMYLYPDGGAYYLREKLADIFNILPGQLIMGNGSNEILEFIGHCYFAPGRSIVVSAHAFVIYKLIAALFDTEVIEVPATENYGHDLDAMAAAVRNDTCAVFVCNPNNPTGTMVGEDEMRRFMAKIPEQVLVVLDEAYAEIALSDMPDTPAIIADYPNSIMLRTFSKAYGLAGLRAGYGVASEDIVGSLQKTRQPFNLNRMAQKAGLAALDDDDFIERSKLLFRESREYLVEQCVDMGLDYVPTSTNFMLVKVGDGAAVTRKLMERGVIVRPMAGYGLPEFIRISFGTMEQNHNFMRELRTVLNK